MRMRRPRICPPQRNPIIRSLSNDQIDGYLQGSSKRQALGLVNFVPAVACHLCLKLPAAFSQPGACLILEPCTPKNCAHFQRKCMLSEEEIRDRYLQFKKDCPSGFLSRSHFSHQKIMTKLHIYICYRSKFLDIIGGGMGPDAEEVVDGIFKVNLSMEDRI